MKKQYETPQAEKLEFSFEQNVVASNQSCPADYKYGPIIQEVCPADHKF